MRLISKAQYARAEGLSSRTVSRYLARGMPHTRDERGHILIDADQAAMWRAARGLSGTPGPPSGDDAIELTARVRAKAVGPPTAKKPRVPDHGEGRLTVAKATAAQKALRARQLERELAADKALGDLGLDKQIRGARTFDDLSRLSRESAALVASGALSPARASAIQRLLAESRQSLKLQPEVDLEQVLTTHEGVALLEAFEQIVDGRRREAVLAYVVGQLEEDAAALPLEVAEDADSLNAKLGELGLDAWGDEA